MSIREEFEKDYSTLHVSDRPDFIPKRIALWAARWMAEAIISHYDLGASAEINIRQLAKELSDGE